MIFSGGEKVIWAVREGRQSSGRGLPAGGRSGPLLQVPADHHGARSGIWGAALPPGSLHADGADPF